SALLEAGGEGAVLRSPVDALCLDRSAVAAMDPAHAVLELDLHASRVEVPPVALSAVMHAMRFPAALPTTGDDLERSHVHDQALPVEGIAANDDALDAEDDSK